MNGLPEISPMVPVTSETIPHGDDWGFQLKWDGIRILTRIEEEHITLYSRRKYRQNEVFPEFVEALTLFQGKTLWLDGEAVCIDPLSCRPVFQNVLRRQKMRQSTSIQTLRRHIPVTYVLFDLLYEDGHDLRTLPYTERHHRLRTLLPQSTGTLWIADWYSDGEKLWHWTMEHEWEGIVSKRLSSPYSEGKNHQDWFKIKHRLAFTVLIKAVVYRNENVTSLVMFDGNQYVGKVSLGLNEKTKSVIHHFVLNHTVKTSETTETTIIPKERATDRIVRLSLPFPCRVSAVERTESGALRQPKIIDFPSPNFVEG